MPPKKKEEEIDVSTLPPWVSKNVVLICSGSLKRSQSIMNEIRTNSNKMVRFIDETEIIENAKAKQLFVDISTLTQKQKKELKSETPTQLTDEVKAKSMALLISQLNIASRVEKKNKLDALNQPPDLKKVPKKEAKKEQKQQQPVVQKQYNKSFDSLYLLEKYPQKIEDLKLLSQQNQSVNFVILLKPQLIYPEQDDVDEEYEENINENSNEGQQNINASIDRKKIEPKYPKQRPTQQDNTHNNQINTFIKNVKQAKKTVSTDSQFRNCVIRQIKLEINLDKQVQQLKNIPEFVFESICDLSLQRGNYDAWLKSKLKRQFSTAEVTEKEQTPLTYHFNTPLDLLLQAAHSIQKIIKDPALTQQQLKQKQLQMIEDLFESKINTASSSKIEEKHEHFNENYWPAPQKIFTKQQKAIFQKLMLPGIDRTLMPQIPQKSYQKRRHEESSYINFIQGDIDDFSRVKSISEFEKIMEMVQSSKYLFNDRVYEEYHDKQSIIDTFTRIFLHDPELLTKYDQTADSLYVAVFFKSPDSRLNYKKWVADCKTLPNFDNWLNNFKDNENNFKNTHFYDIDDMRLGNITQFVKQTSPDDKSIVIQRMQQACDLKQTDLKVIKDEVVFGVKDKGDKFQFWYTNFGHRITVTKSETRFQVILTLLSGLIIILNEKGQVYQKHHHSSMKILPNGFTIIYDDHASPKILHPNGGLTITSQSYSNPRGLGVAYPNVLKQIPTLKRTGSTHSVTKRADQTIIVQEGNKKWIKFYEGTVYQLDQSNIKIDKKGFAQGIYAKDIKYAYQDIQIVGTLQGEMYTFEITFKDRSKVTIDGKGVFCKSGSASFQDSSSYYQCNFQNKELVYVDKNTLRFKVENIQQEKGYEKQYSQRGDISEPRLFLIKNDNSAVQFFSEKQLKKYFIDKSSDPNALVKTTRHPKSELIEVVSKVYPRPKVASISPTYPQNLDILPVPSSKGIDQPNKISTLRILSKFKPISNEMKQKFNQTLKLHQEWKAEHLKSVNQFGYCVNNPQNLEQEMKFFQKTIDRRRQVMKENPYHSLRDDLLNQLVKKVVLQNKLISKNQDDEIQIMSKKISKQSQNNQKQQEQKKEKQSSIKASSLFIPYHPCKNYFQTPQGATALNQMPKSAFESPSQIDSNVVENQTEAMLSSKSMSKGIPQSAPNPQLIDHSIKTNTQYPIYQLPLDQTNNNTSKFSQKSIVIKPSIFTQQDIDQQQKALEGERKSYQKRALKRKEVDVYGNQRIDKPIVPTLLRTQPVSQVNQKYILTESMTAQKVKISSMKNRMMMNSSNLSELRRQGPHQALMKSIDMGNTLQQIHQKRTKMVQADLKDSLSRDILILPAEANFGVVKQNSIYQLKIDVKNEDVMLQRIAIKRPKTNMVKAFLSEMGPIPLGISRKIIVQLRTIPQMKGKFIDEFEIVSKHQIYRIPVSAQIVSEESFNSMGLKESKSSFLKLGVSQLKIESNVRGRGTMTNISQLPKIEKWP